VFVGLPQNGLSHQFSLPKTSSEMAAIEKFLQFQDAVPCKIRAKRGCATHPRSIAERVKSTTCRLRLIVLLLHTTAIVFFLDHKLI
jgi:hypothetical protein